MGLWPDLCLETLTEAMLTVKGQLLSTSLSTGGRSPKGMVGSYRRLGLFEGAGSCEGLTMLVQTQSNNLVLCL